MTGVSRTEALKLALEADEAALFAAATRLREEQFGRAVELCAIINARSGNCDMNCAFCSQSSRSQAVIEPFPLLDDNELQQRILALAATPVRHIGIVTSGGILPERDLARLTTLIATLTHTYPHLHGRLCGSLGRLSENALHNLRAAGMTRFHHNLESGEQFYASICSTQRWADRAATLVRAVDAGLEVCSGGLFGMGETWEDRLDLAFALQRRGVRNVPINFLHAHPGTPLSDITPLAAAEALRIIAVFRHILPNATLRLCGGRPQTLGNRQCDMFAAGANALMTGDYLTTNGCKADGDMALIRSLGLEIA